MYFALTNFWLSWKRLIATSARESESSLMSCSASLFTSRDFAACSFLSARFFNKLCFDQSSFKITDFNGSWVCVEFRDLTKNKSNYSVEITSNLGHSYVLSLKLDCDWVELFYEFQKFVEFLLFFFNRNEIVQIFNLQFWEGFKNECTPAQHVVNQWPASFITFNRVIVGVLT